MTTELPTAEQPGATGSTGADGSPGSARADAGAHTGPGAAGEADDKRFLDQLRREIDEEVRRRRAAGDFPPSFERKLDELFARFTPTGVHDDHFTDALKLADRAAYFDVQVPLGSRRRPQGFVKWVLWQTQAWFVGYVVRQLNHFSAAVMRVVHLLDERVEVNERELELLTTAPLPDEEAIAAAAASGVEGAAHLPEAVVERVVAVVGAPGVPAGRVLHAECGEGDVVAALAKAGLDAYGIDPGTPASDRAAAAGLDVRRDDTLGHLGSVGDGRLAGLVLSGCVDRMTVSERRRLLSLAELKVAPGGVVCVIGTAPERWIEQVGPVLADLAPERPWHAATWAHLVGQLGFESVESTDGARAAGGDEPAARDEAGGSEAGEVGAGEVGAAQLAAVLARVERLERLAGAAAGDAARFVVSATKRR